MQLPLHEDLLFLLPGMPPLCHGLLVLHRGTCRYSGALPFTPDQCFHFICTKLSGRGLRWVTAKRIVHCLRVPLLANVPDG